MQTIYRWTFRSLLAYLPMGLYFGLFATIMDLMVFSIFRNIPLAEIPLIFWFVGAASIFISLCSLFIISLPFVQGFFGYIKVSPEGLEYQRWPFSKNHFKWESVESIRKGVINAQTPFYRGALKYGSLLIRRKRRGWEYKTIGGTLGSAEYLIVPISEFQGWTDGSLVANLKLYAPHLSTEE